VHYEEPIEVPHTRDRAADVGRATAALVAVYERYVRRWPEQWFNFFDFWGDRQG
jgi:KDO2-lipid IV(A) lauroyltransferase